jgi:hypothetical protein
MSQNCNTKEITSGSTDRRLTCLKERADQHEADCYEENGLNNVGQREGAERRVCALLLRQLGEAHLVWLFHRSAPGALLSTTLSELEQPRASYSQGFIC